VRRRECGQADRVGEGGLCTHRVGAVAAVEVVVAEPRLEAGRQAPLRMAQDARVSFAVRAHESKAAGAARGMSRHMCTTRPACAARDGRQPSRGSWDLVYALSDDRIDA
jgi:hypothetical protein